MKRWHLEKLWDTCKVAVWHFRSLTFYSTSCFGFACSWKFTYLKLAWYFWIRRWWLWILPSPRLASVVGWSSNGIGLVASVNAQLRTGLPAGSRTCPGTTCRWCRGWWSAHCWGWETGQALTHYLEEHHPFSLRDSRRNGTTLVLRRWLRLE